MGYFLYVQKRILKILPHGKLNEDFFMYVEDMQWCIEFRNLGYSIAFQPAAQVVHHMGKSGGPKSALIDENIDRFMRKYYSSFEIRCMRLLDRVLL
jgi:GT2 family glycosyltransferase